MLGFTVSMLIHSSDGNGLSAALRYSIRSTWISFSRVVADSASLRCRAPTGPSNE